MSQFERPNPTINFPNGIQHKGHPVTDLDLTKAEVRLLQELRKQRASDEQLAALPKLHKRAAGYPATPPPGYIKHIVKPIEIDFLNYQEQD